MVQGLTFLCRGLSSVFGSICFHTLPLSEFHVWITRQGGLGLGILLSSFGCWIGWFLSLSAK